MFWFIAALSSVIALALAELAQRHLLRKEGVGELSSGVFTFLLQSALGTTTAILFLAPGSLLTIFQGRRFIWLLIVSCIGSVAMRLYLRSLKASSISLSSIFGSWSAVVSTALGAVVFGEGLGAVKLTGILLVFLAIALLYFKNSSLERNNFFALASGLMFGAAYTLDKKIVLETHPLVYLSWGFFLVALIGLMQAPRRTIVELKQMKSMDLMPLSISALCYFIYNLLTFTAYTLGGEVGRIDAINNTQVFLIITVEYFFFRQREGMQRKLICAALAFAGVVILGQP